MRIGINSRLDTIQAAVLLAKFPVFAANEKSDYYKGKLKDIVDVPIILDGFYSSWAQYTIKLKDRKQRDNVQRYLKERDIPAFIYYPKPMHMQKAFAPDQYVPLPVSEKLCDRVISLPISPYVSMDEIDMVCESVNLAIL